MTLLYGYLRKYMYIFFIINHLIKTNQNKNKVGESRSIENHPNSRPQMIETRNHNQRTMQNKEKMAINGNNFAKDLRRQSTKYIQKSRF